MKLNTAIYATEDQKNICGMQNRNLNLIENIYGVSIDIHGENIITDAKDEKVIADLEMMFSSLLFMSKLNLNINERDIIYVKNVIDIGKLDIYLSLLKGRKAVGHTFLNKPIFPKTITQYQYIDSLRKKDIVFAYGSAGTGKTYLAVVYAVSELKKGNFKKIILTRPAVEAGESLGFLPGDLKEKVDPYLRPLYDALFDCLGEEQVNALLDKGMIEIAPLAYMRGRTLDNAFVILDEAQNATHIQMKMFLTRLGFNSKMVITGDISQIDLPKGTQSGLVEATSILKCIPEIAIIVFEMIDVVRHPLVGKILERYESK